MSRGRRCRYTTGAIFCGGDPTAEDLAAVEGLRRRLRGELGLREAREQAGLSLEQAAKMLPWSRDELAAMEAGAALPQDVGPLLELYRVRGISAGGAS